jgi:hypothetical protein
LLIGRSLFWDVTELLLIAEMSQDVETLPYFDDCEV